MNLRVAPPSKRQSAILLPVTSGVTMQSMSEQKPTLDYEPVVSKGRHRNWIIMLGIVVAVISLLVVLIAWGSLIVSGLGEP